MEPGRAAGAATAAAGVVLLKGPSALSGPILIGLSSQHGVHALDVVAPAAVAIGLADAVRRS